MASKHLLAALQLFYSLRSNYCAPLTERLEQAQYNTMNKGVSFYRNQFSYEFLSGTCHG